MRTARLKVSGVDATYHCMTRTVNGERLFGDREKEVFRKMLWQVADFCGVEVLTYALMSNHFHVLVRIPEPGQISDKELMRRWRVLYPKPTKYETATAAAMEKSLAVGGEEAEVIRRRLMARMYDLSEFMKTVKQRFTTWFNKSHGRYGTLWADRFKSVLVEGRGNPLQTMAAYIDLNPVRAGIVEDPKDYRFCGYAEAVAGNMQARRGLQAIWSDRGAPLSAKAPYQNAMRSHRELIFGKRASDAGLSEMSRKKALKVLDKEDALLPKTTVLRCRVRYFTDGAILGSQEYVRGCVGAWQLQKKRKHPPKPNLLRGADWQDLATIQGLRKQVFG
ncbi:MAG: transposase [Opitutales bacterium]